MRTFDSNMAMRDSASLSFLLVCFLASSSSAALNNPSKSGRRCCLFVSCTGAVGRESSVPHLASCTHHRLLNAPFHRSRSTRRVRMSASPLQSDGSDICHLQYISRGVISPLLHSSIGGAYWTTPTLSSIGGAYWPKPTLVYLL